MPWSTSADSVLAEAGNPKGTDLGFTNDSAMKTHTTSFLIPAAQNLIEQYVKTTYADSTVPPAVAHAAIRIAATGLMKIRIRKMGVLVRVADWQVELSSAVIFTPEIKAELADFVQKTGPVFWEQPTD